MTFHFVVKSLSDLVNESLTLSEEDAVAAASTATSSRLSPSSSSSPRQQTVAAAATNPSTAMATPSTADPVATTTAFPTLSSLASEAIDELPSVKLLKRLQPPTHKLIAITKSMNHHLTSLLVSFISLAPYFSVEIVQMYAVLWKPLL